MKWFKHMSDASDDEFLALLEAELGLEAYARWWKMLEVIAKQMDGSERCHVEYPMDKWLQYLSEKRQKSLRKFLDYCELSKKISTEYSGNILKITCPKLLELRDEYSRKSGHTPDTAPDNVAPDIRRKKEEERKKSTAGAVQSGARTRTRDPTDFEKIYEAGCAVSPKLADADTSAIHQWIAAGCDVGLDAVPAIQRLAKTGKNIRSWSFFSGAVADAKATRETPLPNGHGKTQGLPQTWEEIREQKNAEVLENVRKKYAKSE